MKPPGTKAGPTIALHSKPGARAVFMSNLIGPARVSAERYAWMRRILLIGLIALSTLPLLGCLTHWKVVFINGSEQPFTVHLSGGLDGKERVFALPQERSHTERLDHVGRLAVFSASGALLFQQDDFRAKKFTPPFPGRDRHAYVLLTTTNAYLIPPEYVKTWREHADEITKPGA